MGGYYQEPAVFDNFRMMKSIWDKYSASDYDSVSEIAMIVDPDSSYYLNPDWAEYKYCYSALRNNLNRVAAPFDIFSFNDIPNIPDFSRYKLLVFANPFVISPEKEDLLKKFVFKDMRTVVWLFAPGIIDGMRYCPERVKDICGMDFTCPDIASVQKENWTSIYVPVPSALTTLVLKKVAAEAGVNIYCDEALSVYGNSRLLSIHSAEGGNIMVRLPRKYKAVKELYSNIQIGCDISSFCFDFCKPDTRLFELLE